ATVLSRIRPGVGVMMMIGSGASQLLLDSYYFVDDKYTAQSWLFFVIGILAMFAVSRPPSMARLKAWIAGKPEPKSPPRDGSPTPMPAHGS
ncbi:MAG: hypothetical protein KC492_19540, partial [Myxococcales bacterium]|nr:hypothetical protein [Myxococcales bacterium]